MWLAESVFIDHHTLGSVLHSKQPFCTVVLRLETLQVNVPVLQLTFIKTVVVFCQWMNWLIIVAQHVTHVQYIYFKPNKV